MKEHHNINFNLFCQRKGFNLQRWIESNPDLTFEDLKKSLLNIKVMPPSLELFNSLKPVVLNVKDVEEKPIVKKVIKEETKQDKPVKRRRRRKTVEK
tara:strand:+ start:31 stop:321 length:291 start_codon:yes stop_codon:yes gene_type:complete